MVTVTVSAVVAHLDNLVLDYIQRRNQNSMVLPSPFHATNPTEGYRQATQDITLEEIYFDFVGKSTLRDKPLTNVVNITKCRDFSDVQSSMQPPTPYLPIEIVEQVLEFLSVKQLRLLRCLSRGMYNMLTKRIQYFQAMPNLETPEKVEQFLRDFGNRMQHLNLPFGKLHFGRNLVDVPRVLEVVGSQLVVNLYELEAKELTRDVLAKIANVRTLCVRGLPNIAEIESMKDVKLPALHHLELRQKNDVQYFGNELNFEYIKSWLRLAPSLRQFYSRIQATLPPAQAIQLFRSHASLSSIHVNELDISWKDGDMEVAMMPIDLGHTPDLALYANFLRRLSIPYAFPHRLPPFPRLTHLTLLDYPPGPLLPLQLNATPLLQHVTLNPAISRSFSAIYQNSVFESVSSLCFKDGSWWWNESRPPLFHLIFPKVANLELSGRLPAEYINYFAAHFSSVSTMKFTDFENLPHMNLPLFEVRGPGRTEIEWPFFKFQNLKVLEFKCEENVRTTVLKLVWLTLNKYMQPLQKLRVVQLCYRDYKEFGDRDLYYSMRHLKYHKELEFRVDTFG